MCCGNETPGEILFWLGIIVIAGWTNWIVGVVVMLVIALAVIAGGDWREKREKQKELARKETPEDRERARDMYIAEARAQGYREQEF